MTNKPYEIIADTRKMTHADWLQMRKAGIGGSDCSAAVGLSRWKSPFMLWSEKTDRIIPSKAGEAAYWGSVMEPILRAEGLGHQHARTDGGAHGEGYDEKNQLGTAAYRGQRVASQKSSHYNGIHGVVKLLQQISKDQWDGKNQNLPPDWALRHSVCRAHTFTSFAFLPDIIADPAFFINQAF